MEYPTLKKLLSGCEQRHPDAVLCFADDRIAVSDVATELRALLSERDALAAQAEARPEAPGRRLREYKGVTYRDGAWCRGDQRFGTAAHVITADDSDCTDADHAELLALRDDPWQDAGTLEDAIERGRKAWFGDPMGGDALPFVAREVRTWLAQQPAPELTAAQHIKALRKIGAQWYPRVTSLRTPYEGAVISWWPLTGGALVLPEELAPTAEDVFGKDWDK
jgi:hypothetical protein